MLIPALSANSMVPGVCAMPECSHITNFEASPYVRTIPPDSVRRRSYNANMARRGVPKGPINWYLPEWMDALGKKQADMMKLTGWSKATASQLYNGTQDYSPKVVNEAAQAFHCAPYELLMPYEEAMALRRVRGDAKRLVESGEKLDRPMIERTGTDG